MLTELQQNAISTQLNQDFLDEIHDELDELLLKLSDCHSQKKGVPQSMMAYIATKFQTLSERVKDTNCAEIEKSVDAFSRGMARLKNMALQDADIIVQGIERLRSLVEAESAHYIRLKQSADKKHAGNSSLKNLSKHILFIGHERTLPLIIGREIGQFGFQVHQVTNMLDLVSLTPRYAPCLIICNATLDETSGVEIAHNLRVNPVTSAIPFALLTSFDSDHPLLANLPPNTPILRKGENFKKDFQTTITLFNL